MYGYGAPVYGTGVGYGSYGTGVGGMGMGVGMGMGMGGVGEIRTQTIRQTPYGVVDTITDQVYPTGGYGMGGMGMGYGGSTTVDTIQRTPFGTVETIRSVPNYGAGGYNTYGTGGFY